MTDSDKIIKISFEINLADFEESLHTKFTDDNIKFIKEWLKDCDEFIANDLREFIADNIIKKHKIERIKYRINELIEIKYQEMRNTQEKFGCNNVGFGVSMGADDELVDLLKEIESGEIYE